MYFLLPPNWCLPNIEDHWTLFLAFTWSTRRETSTGIEKGQVDNMNEIDLFCSNVSQKTLLIHQEPERIRHKTTSVTTYNKKTINPTFSRHKFSIIWSEVFGSSPKLW